VADFRQRHMIRTIDIDVISVWNGSRYAVLLCASDECDASAVVSVSPYATHSDIERLTISRIRFAAGHVG
jgi:selenocysteine lyase/cysteine desulfurase